MEGEAAYLEFRQEDRTVENKKANMVRFRQVEDEEGQHIVERDKSVNILDSAESKRIARKEEGKRTAQKSCCL